MELEDIVPAIKKFMDGEIKHEDIVLAIEELMDGKIEEPNEPNPEEFTFKIRHNIPVLDRQCVDSLKNGTPEDANRNLQRLGVGLNSVFYDVDDPAGHETRYSYSYSTEGMQIYTSIGPQNFTPLSMAMRGRNIDVIGYILRQIGDGWFMDLNSRGRIIEWGLGTDLYHEYIEESSAQDELGNPLKDFEGSEGIDRDPIRHMLIASIIYGKRGTCVCLPGKTCICLPGETGENGDEYFRRCLKYSIRTWNGVQIIHSEDEGSPDEQAESILNEQDDQTYSPISYQDYKSALEKIYPNTSIVELLINCGQRNLILHNAIATNNIPEIYSALRFDPSLSDNFGVRWGNRGLTFLELACAHIEPDKQGEIIYLLRSLNDTCEIDTELSRERIEGELLGVGRNGPIPDETLSLLTTPIPKDQKLEMRRKIYFEMLLGERLVRLI